MQSNKKNILLLFPKFEEGFFMGKVPLGLAYIASALKSRGHYVEAYNLIVDPIEKIDFEKFDYCGITCLTSFIGEVRRMVEYIKEKNPKIKIVLGGSHPSIMMEDTLKISNCVDFIIAGEGELAFPELIEKEDDCRGVKGVYWFEGNKMMGEGVASVSNLDDLPYPDQHIFDHGRLETRNPYRGIIASRGCPFGCYNCQPFLNRVSPFRLRSPAAVVKEMLYRNSTDNQDYFGFVDSEFPLNKKWFMEYKSLINTSGKNFRFHCNTRSDLVDDDIMAGYKQLNISRLAIGVESGNQHVVDNVLNKKIDLEDTRKIFDMAVKHKINTHAHFMIGVPGETLENMQHTLDYALSINVNSLEFNMVTPWPGTAFYDICKKNNWLTKGLKLEDYNEKRIGVVSTDKWTNKDVMAFYEHIRKTFIAKGWKNSEDGSVFFREHVGR